MKREHIVLLSCATIFIVCSLGLYYAAANTESAHLDLDSQGYDRIGLNFAIHNRLIDPARGPIIPVQMLGYPLFLGIIYKLFGHQYFYVIIVQVLPSLLSGWLLYLIALRLFNKTVALVTALLCSINLGFLVYSQFILTEILLVTLLIAGFERFFCFIQKPSWIFLAESGLLFGLSVLVKPVVLFYLVILLLCMIFALHSSFKKIALFIMLFLSCFSMPIIGYMIHNKIVYNAFMLSPIMHESIYCYFLAKLITHEQNIPYQKALAQTYAMLNVKDPCDNKRWEVSQQLLKNFMYQKPFMVGFVWLQNVFKTFCGLYTSQLKFLINPDLKGTETSFFEKRGTLLERIHHYLTDGLVNTIFINIMYWMTFWFILHYISLAVGFFMLYRIKRYWLLAFFGCSIAYFMLITGHDGCARQRMLSEGLIILVSAFGLEYIVGFLRNFKGYICKRMMC